MPDTNKMIQNVSYLHKFTFYNRDHSHTNVYTYDFKFFDVVITTYGVVRNDIEILKNFYFHYIILDESQNTTSEQMKMFLTRIGFGSTAVITGDVTQVDLPRATQSGLRHVIEVLKDVEGVSFTFFNAHDVVRHPLVQRIVTAYASYEKDRNGGT